MNKILIIILFLFITFSNSFAKKIDFKGLKKLTIDDLNRITSVDLLMDSYSLVDIDQIVKELYASDLIENVSLTNFSDNFLITIKEYLIIENIYINGNIYIKDDTINSFLSSKIIKSNKSKVISDLKISGSFMKLRIQKYTDHFLYGKVFN